jgi:hypothetical protein
VVNSKRNRTAFYIIGDNRVGTDPGTRPDFNWSQDLGAGANVDVVSDPGNTRSLSVSDRNLLKDQAIHADLSFRMNYDAIGMGNEETAANLACQRDIGAGYGTPEPMAQHQPLNYSCRHNAVAALPLLVAAYRRE